MLSIPDGGAASGASGAGLNRSRRPRLTLLTRPDCSLCADARAVVERVAADFQIDWEEMSIAEDQALSDRFGEEVPVLMFDGVQRDFWQIDEARLRTVLRRSGDTGP